MTDQPPLNPDALEAAAKALEDRITTDTADLEADGQMSLARHLEALAAVSAYLAVAQPVVNSEEHLRELVAGTVILDSSKSIYEVDRAGFLAFLEPGQANWYAFESVDLPARVLYIPEVDE